MCGEHVQVHKKHFMKLLDCQDKRTKTITELSKDVMETYVLFLGCASGMVTLIIEVVL